MPKAGVPNRILDLYTCTCVDHDWSGLLLVFGPALNIFCLVDLSEGPNGNRFLCSELNYIVMYRSLSEYCCLQRPVL